MWVIGKASVNDRLRVEMPYLLGHEPDQSGRIALAISLPMASRNSPRPGAGPSPAMRARSSRSGTHGGGAVMAHSPRPVSRNGKWLPSCKSSGSRGACRKVNCQRSRTCATTIAYFFRRCTRSRRTILPPVSATIPLGRGFLEWTHWCPTGMATLPRTDHLRKCDTLARASPARPAALVPALATRHPRVPAHDRGQRTAPVPPRPPWRRARHGALLQ